MSTKPDQAHNAVFSPDGHWVAYRVTSPEGAGIFVQPFPPTRAKVQIAVTVGIHPVWSPDGKELMYLLATGQMAAVSVTTQPTFAVGNPVQVPGGGLVANPGLARPYDMAPDGRMLGIVIAQAAGGATTPEIQVVLNWLTELQQRVPTR